MLIVPISVEEVVIPAECIKLPYTGLQYATSLTSIQVSNGNTHFRTDGKIVYEGTSLLLCIGSVNNVSINASTTSISSKAFSYNKQIIEVDLSQTQISVIHEYVFEYARLETIVLPSSLQMVHYYAFIMCTSLKTNTFSMEAECDLIFATGCFELCTKLTSITFPSNLISIGSRAFYKSGLQNITFSYNSMLTEIQDEAFYNCKIEEIHFPNSLQTIGENAFYFNNLKCIFFGQEITSIGNYAFTNNKQLETVIFPSGSKVSIINPGAFSQCTSLTSFAIPSSVSDIKPSVFEGCINLTDLFVSEESESSSLHHIDGIIYSSDYKQLIICPNGKIKADVDFRVVQIGNNAFYGCIKLENLSFKTDSYGISSLEIIGSNTFYQCISLESVHFPNSLKHINENAFFGCIKFISLYFETKSQLTTLGTKTFSGCSKLTNVHFPIECNLKELSESLFEDCSSLASILIPNIVEKISERCFRNCLSLSSVTFYTNESLLTTIDNEAFGSCTSLRLIKLPISLET